jgi:hypothetical protein
MKKKSTVRSVWLVLEAIEILLIALVFRWLFPSLSAIEAIAISTLANLVDLRSELKSKGVI